MSPNTERQYRRLLQEAELLDGPVEVLPELEDLKVVVLRSLPAPVILPAQQTSWIEGGPAAPTSPPCPPCTALCATAVMRTRRGPCSGYPDLTEAHEVVWITC